MATVNFVPVRLQLPDGVATVEVDLARELEQLAFAVVQSGRGPSVP